MIHVLNVNLKLRLHHLGFTIIRKGNLNFPSNIATASLRFTANILRMFHGSYAKQLIKFVIELNLKI